MKYYSIFLCLLFFISCSNPFLPEMVNEDIETVSYQFSTPQETLNGLTLSYQNRDIELFRACLSTDFRFELLSSEVSEIGVDMDYDNIPDDWWGYQQEIDYHQNLFIGGALENDLSPPNELSLNLIIPPESSWEQDGIYPDLVKISCNFTLELFYYDSNERINALGIATFYMKQENDRWVIAIWRDESFI